MNTNSEKIEELKKDLPPNKDNFHVETSSEDGNDLLKTLSSQLLKRTGMHYLLFYDPYKAMIDWEALKPYFFGWGEVILNHMVSDPLRALKQSTRLETKRKYEKTYGTSFEELLTSFGDRKDYENRLTDIITDFCRYLKRKFYIVTVPFFIKTNVLIYDLVFFTKHPKGFNLFKEMAWKTFGDKSSNQNTHGEEICRSLFRTPLEDRQCYCVNDIADYIVDRFKGRKSIRLEEIWKFVDEHPIFPTEGYKPKIKTALKQTGLCHVHTSTVDFA